MKSGQLRKKTFLYAIFRSIQSAYDKIGKCFAEIMIPIALLKKLGSKEFVKIIEDSNMRKCSGKVNKVTFSDTIRYDTLLMQ